MQYSASKFTNSISMAYFRLQLHNNQFNLAFHFACPSFEFSLFKWTPGNETVRILTSPCKGCTNMKWCVRSV